MWLVVEMEAGAQQKSKIKDDDDDQQHQQMIIWQLKLSVFLVILWAGFCSKQMPVC